MPLPFVCVCVCVCVRACVCSRQQIGLIVGTVLGSLVIVSIIIVVVVYLCRQRALAEKKTVERVAQIIGATEVSHQRNDNSIGWWSAILLKRLR